jgi:hypothetical protein
MDPLDDTNALSPPHGIATDLIAVLVVPVGNSIMLATDIESGDAPALCERSVA